MGRSIISLHQTFTKTSTKHAAQTSLFTLNSLIGRQMIIELELNELFKSRAFN